MTAEAYCKSTEDKDKLNQSLIATTPIVKSYSSLTTLKKDRFNLMFEPSVISNYEYLVRQGIAGKIVRINRALEKQDKTLIIQAGWYSHENLEIIREHHSTQLQDKFPDKPASDIEAILANFISAEENSMYITGGSVDALIFDDKTGQIMDFGNNEGFKIDLNEKCYPYHPDINELSKKNRELLISLFQYEGFVVNPKKYWNFNYGNVLWAIEKEEKNAIYGIIKG